jgi:hypothetical protein
LSPGVKDIATLWCIWLFYHILEACAALSMESIKNEFEVKKTFFICGRRGFRIQFWCSSSNKSSGYTFFYAEWVQSLEWNLGFQCNHFQFVIRHYAWNFVSCLPLCVWSTFMLLTVIVVHFKCREKGVNRESAYFLFYKHSHHTPVPIYHFLFCTSLVLGQVMSVP